MSTTVLPPQQEAGQAGARAAISVILGVSLAAICFLLWLLYGRHASPEFAGSFTFLPALNAVLNGFSAVSLCVGYSFIRQRRWQAHRAAMLTAFAFSSLFLVSYILHHALHGDTKFPGVGTPRTLYLSLLASHVLLSVVALPLVLTTFFFSLSNRFRQHKKIARYTFPIWLYVSVTGVLVYLMLRAYTH